MSYHEQNGQVTLTMSREDYEMLIFRLGMAAGYEAKCGGAEGQALKKTLAFMDRLNEGNPNYTAYQVTPDSGTSNGPPDLSRSRPRR